MSLELQYYVDVPGRDLTIPDRGAVCWIDIEQGCFQDAQDVRDQGTANTTAGLVTGIYCNRYSLAPVFGASSDLADYGLPLWVADYRPPDYSSFVPFNGWQAPALWQWSSAGWQTPAGLINADVSITPDGRVFVDISNYTTLNAARPKSRLRSLMARAFAPVTLTPSQADYLKYTVDGVIIGLQDAAKARRFKELLSA